MINYTILSKMKESCRKGQLANLELFFNSCIIIFFYDYHSEYMLSLNASMLEQNLQK